MPVITTLHELSYMICDSNEQPSCISTCIETLLNLHIRGFTVNIDVHVYKLSTLLSQLKLILFALESGCPRPALLVKIQSATETSLALAAIFMSYWHTPQGVRPSGLLFLTQINLFHMLTHISLVTISSDTPFTAQSITTLELHLHVHSFAYVLAHTNKTI